MPSLAEALAKAHVALLKDLRQLDEVSRLPSPGSFAEMTTRLAAAREHIAEHFRFEEQNGYLDVVRRREPQMDRTIEELHEEHRQLLLSLNALLEEARAYGGAEGTFREKVRAWVRRVRQHESRENSLVQDAFTTDIGTED